MVATRVRRDARARPGRRPPPNGQTVKRTLGIAHLGGATLDNEENYLLKKLFTALGIVQVENQAAHMTQLHGPRSGDLVRTRRRDDVPAGPAERRLHRHRGLEHGRVPPGRLPLGDGGEGARRDASSTSTRASPAPARWPTSTSRSAPGTDIAFLGGIIRHVLEKERYFREYVVPYTNAAVIIRRGLPRHRGPRRPVQRLRIRRGASTTWAPGSTRARRHRPRGGPQAPPGATRRGRRTSPTSARPRSRSATRRCSTRAASSRSSSGTSPATRRRWWRRSAACRRPLFVKVAETLCGNSGRERTAAFCYAVGWTQHSIGVQYIRTAAILQLLLGNIGRPGGGIMALRGHASIQGSTDIPTLFNLLPGYLPMPHARSTTRRSPRTSRATARRPAGGASSPSTSSRCSRPGSATRPRRRTTTSSSALPRLTGDHSHMTTVADMADGKVEGYFVMGENPAVGSPNGALQRKGLRQARRGWWCATSR